MEGAERSGGTQPKGPGKALRATVRATATARLAADVRALAAIIKHQQLVTDFRENTIRLHLNSHPFAHDNEMRYRTDVLFYCIISKPCCSGESVAIRRMQKLLQTQF